MQARNEEARRRLTDERTDITCGEKIGGREGQRGKEAHSLAVSFVALSGRNCSHQRLLEEEERGGRRDFPLERSRSSGRDPKKQRSAGGREGGRSE